MSAQLTALLCCTVLIFCTILEGCTVLQAAAQLSPPVRGDNVRADCEGECVHSSRLHKQRIFEGETTRFVRTPIRSRSAITHIAHAPARFHTPGADMNDAVQRPVERFDMEPSYGAKDGYDPSLQMSAREDGDWVKATDYDALAAKCEALKQSLAAEIECRDAVMTERDALRTAIYRAWKASCHRLACRTDSEIYLNETLNATRVELFSVYPIPDLHARDHAEFQAEMQRKYPAHVVTP